MSKSDPQVKCLYCGGSWGVDYLSLGPLTMMTSAGLELYGKCTICEKWYTEARLKMWIMVHIIEDERGRA